MIVLDTHTLVWWVNGDVALSDTAKTAIEAAGQTEGGIVVSSIPAWEITMLVQRERIISPLGQKWDSFFLNGPAVSGDFMQERASQTQTERETL